MRRTLLALFFISTLSFAQDFKEIQGRVVHDNLSVEGVHVINATSGATTITDTEGYFTVGARVNDSIVFSAIQFKSHLVVLEPEVFQQDFITVYVEERVNELDEVVVKPHELSGNLEKDMAKVEEPINFYDVGIPGFKGKPQERIPKTGHIIIGSLLGHVPVDEIIRKLNGYYKELRLRRKLDAENAAAVEIIEFYGVGFLMEEYELMLDEVYPFVLGTVMATDMEEDFSDGNHNLAIQDLEGRKQTPPPSREK